MSAISSTDNTQLSIMTTPTPKPRTAYSFGNSNGVTVIILPKKNPVPLPRKSIAQKDNGDVSTPTVRLRPVVIRRGNQPPILMERSKLESILETRPNSYTSTFSEKLCIELCENNNIPSSDIENDTFENKAASVTEFQEMSARAIAAARSRGNDRPLSAYEETIESTINRRRASVAVMPMVELEFRDRMVAGSCSSLLMHTDNDNEVVKERTFSPDFGAIRVQVEDITAVPASLVEEDDIDINKDCGDHHEICETSTETISELNNGKSARDCRKKKKVAVDAPSTSADMSFCTTVADWAVPSEYASSPIAQELTESSFEERPRPPIPSMYMNTLETAKRRPTSSVPVDENSESNYSDFVFRRNSSTSSTSACNTVTLLEQIIRTRTIWFLPHLGRPEVLHLLRKMEPGNFIVRASTRENCMALSARMPPGSNIETDHYIIEKLVLPHNPGSSMTTNVVRLEGSPRTFRSLPDLIQHYSLNDEELEVRLQLPSAIRACTTTKQLLSIALMEQGFWSSDMSLSRKPSRSQSRSSVSSSRINNNTLPRCIDDDGNVGHASTWFMGNGGAIYDEVGNANKYSDEKPAHQSYYAVHDTLVPASKLNNNHSSSGLLTPEMSSNDGSLKTTKKRRSSSRASSASSSRFATVVGDIAYDRQVTDRKFVGDDETDSGLSSHSPPSKHDRIDNAQISRNERRSQSVRSNKSVNLPSLSNTDRGVGSSQTIARLSRPRSFLRSLLSFGTSSTKDQRKNSVKERDSDSTSRLANCEYFTPWERTITPQVRTSRSAFDIANPPSRGFFSGTAPKKRNGSGSNSGFGPSVTGQKPVDIFDDDNYTRGWKEAAYNKEMTAASMKGSPGGRSNASEGLKTFKPSNGDHDSGVSSRVRPLAMRRERSDLSGTNIGIIKNNAQRLAYHNESSPGPATMGSNSRIPMTPPVNANDPQTIKNCVEELRRKRLQSTNEMLAPQDGPYSQINPRNDGAQSAHASPQISMRRRNGFPSPSFNRSGFAGIDRHRSAEHRLSVPNLIAVTDPLIPGNVGQSAKALRERMGRNPDGELMVINEGLVTPVVRRKNFATSKADHVENKKSENDNVTSGKVAEVEGGSVAAGDVAKRKEAFEALFDRQKHGKQQQFDSMSSGSDQSSLGRKNSQSDRIVGPPGAESELIWRRAKQQQASKLGGLRTSGPSWSAINYELKNRQQKVAKVLPTPQPRVTTAQQLHHHQQQRLHSKDRMTVGGVEMVNVANKRSSDYAQICDCSTSGSDAITPRGIHLDVHSKIEDDAVSVAGTVFNEPWDSNVWENLLDLAHHGDESVMGLKVSEVIEEEEDSDSDRTAGGGSTCQMESDDDEDDDDEEEEELRWPSDDSKNSKRSLPSDCVIVKAWEQDKDKDTDGASTKFNTLDSRTKSIDGTLKRNPEGSFSIRSLPRALSRFSHGLGMMGTSCGSIDDLPTTLPSMSPLLGGRFSRGHLPTSSSSMEKIGHAVQEYVEHLAQVKEGQNACFGMTLRQFVACTKDTKETDPSVVVRNVRQFINGMKNYLVKHGEGDLHRIIDEESSRLNSNQILNIDAVLEAVLHKLLLREVKPLLYHVMVREHSKSGTLQMISSNIGVVRKMNLAQLGFSRSESLSVPSQQTMEQVKLVMRKMQSHYSPMKKLENLMKAVSMVVSCQNKSNVSNENSDPAYQRGIPAADDLVRWLVYILARTSTVGCEVEAWYMWELLPQPILMQSDASYYLTALFSAVHVLKSADSIKRLCENDQQVISSLDMARQCCSSPLLSTATLTRGTSASLAQQVTSAACDAFVKIAVPDETVGCVRYATFPGVPLLTTSKLSRLVAHQQGITNPEEHGLYLISDGFESCLQPTDCPVMIHEQLKKENKPHLFAYKRHEAKIAWPRAAISAC